MRRYDKGKFYPRGKKGNYTQKGKGLGCGFNINVPLDKYPSGDADYYAIWDQILLPVAKAFNPEIILISGGFDAGK